MFSRQRTESKLMRAVNANMQQIIALLEKHNPKPKQERKLDMVALFRDLQQLLPFKQFQDFLPFLQDPDNIPFEYGNLESMSVDRFNSLLELWLSTSKEKEEEAYSVAQSEEYIVELDPIVALMQDLMKKRSEPVRDYLNTLPDKTRLGDFNINQLLKEVLGGTHYLYEFDTDTEHFFDKVGSYVTLLNIIKGYRKSHSRNIKPSDDEKYIYLKELPYIVGYWQGQNGQLSIESTRRKEHKGMQTSINNKTSSLHGSHTMKEGETGPSLQAILNNSIEQLKHKKYQTSNSQWLESIDYIIITLRKQRSRLFPQYRTNNGKLFTQPSLLEQSNHGTQSKDTEKIRNDLLKEIFIYYREKHIEDTDEHEQHRLGPEQLSTNRTVMFLRDSGIGRNPITQKRTQSILDVRLKKRRAVNLNEFVSLINELFPLEESMLNTNTLQNFVNTHIRPNYFQKTIKTSKRYQRREKILTMVGQKPTSSIRQSSGLKTPCINCKSPVQNYKNSGVLQARRKKHRIWIEEIYKTGAATPVRDSKSPSILNRHSLQVRHSQTIDQPSERAGGYLQNTHVIQEQEANSKRRRKYRSNFRKS